MKLEIWLFGITLLILYNIYHDGKYTKMIMSYKKYYKMIIIGIVAISLYIMLKRNPTKSKQMLLYTNNLIKYMPIDKSSMDMLSPIFDFTSKTNNTFMNNLNSYTNPNFNYNPELEKNISMNQRNLTSNKTTKRSVSETKKKYVAANQDWKCGNCNTKLTHTFEVDHKIRLEYGGSNDPSNLVALCRECHGQKTAMENM